MIVSQLRTRVPDSKAEGFIGRIPQESTFALVVRGAATIFKPNGELLCVVRPGGISESSKERAMPFLSRASKQVSKNRGSYLGETSDYVRADGERSNTIQTPPVRSSIHGFFDRNPRFPFCRQTAFVSREPEAWAEVRPSILEVAALLRAAAPKRYAVQLEAAKKTHPTYVIEGSPFTTLTVNGTVAGAYHRDSGDFRAGFGAMSVFRAGEYRGCWLGFPAFSVAVDLQDRDVILFDPHEIHGNTPFLAEGEPHVDFTRISVVYYFRERMLECLPPEQELEHAKARGAILSDGPI